MVKLIPTKIAIAVSVLWLSTLGTFPQALRTFNSTNDLVDASHNPMSQNTNSWIINTNDMSYQLWTWWQGDTSAVGTYNLQSLRPGVVGRFKLVENLHWNHIPDVNGDTFVIINNTNQSGLIGALTVPYIPYASGTNKLRDSHLYWMTNGTGTDTNLYFGPGTTNVLYRTGNSLVLTNAGKTNGFDIINTNGTKLRLGFLDNGSAPRLTTPAAAIWLGAPVVFEGNAIPDQDNTRGIGTASSTGAWADFFQKGSHYLEAFNDGLGTNVVWLRSFMSNKTAIINFVSQTNGVNGEISGVSVRTNGVEVFNVTGTGGPSSGANWTAVGTTDSSLAGTATASGLVSQGTLGSELIVNGTFDTDLSSWINPVLAVGWSAGSAKWTNDSSGNAFSQTVAASVQGHTYRVAFTWTGVTTGAPVRVRYGGSEIDLDTTTGMNGSWVEYLTATTATTAFEIFTGLNFDGTLDNVSLKEVTGGTMTVDGQSIFQAPIEVKSSIAFPFSVPVRIGYHAGQANTLGTYSSGNTFVGHNAGQVTTSGTVTAVGQDTAFSTTTGSAVAVGHDAAYGNTTGTITAIGESAGAVSDGRLIAIGYHAGSLFDGNDPYSDIYGILIGDYTGRTVAFSTQLTNYVGIGHGVKVDSSNEAVLGNDNITKTLLKGNVGIATNAPSEALEVAGNIKASGSVTAGSFDVPLLSLGDVNTNLVIDFATLGFRTANLTNDSYITVTGMPATVARTLEYKIFTGNTNRNVFWQVGLSNSMGAPLPAILPSNNVVRLTLQSTGTTVTNVDAYVTWRTP